MNKVTENRLERRLRLAGHFYIRNNMMDIQHVEEQGQYRPAFTCIDCIKEDVGTESGQLQTRDRIRIHMVGDSTVRPKWPTRS